MKRREKKKELQRTAAGNFRSLAPAPCSSLSCAALSGGVRRFDCSAPGLTKAAAAAAAAHAIAQNSTTPLYHTCDRIRARQTTSRPAPKS